MKKVFFTIFFFVGLLLALNFFIYAQETPAPAETEIAHCLEAERCGNCTDRLPDGSIDPDSCSLYEDSRCSGEDGGSVSGLENRARLWEKADDPLTPGKDTYVIECLSVDDELVCTSGSSNVDNYVFGQDNLSMISKNFDEGGIAYRFEGFYEADGSTTAPNPIPATTQFGEYEWQDHTPRGYSRKYYGLNYTDPGLGVEETSNNEGGVQQARMEGFVFENPGNNSDCATVSWDPYGRVFDSQTLEPVKGAKITLLVKRTDGSYTPVTTKDALTIKNPLFTEEDGFFNFVVPAGDYKIVVEHTDYNFPHNASILNSNYRKIYWQIYPSQTGEVIQERPPKMEYRDIPLDPKIMPVKHEVKLMENFYDKQKSNGKTIIEGRVSHPFALINVYSLKNNLKHNLVGSAQADKMGRFQITVDENKFEPGEVLGEIEYSKINLTKDLNQKNNSQGTALVQSIKIDPILNYLEGYAYDLNNQLLPNATVGIYLKFSNKPYYTTKADNKGYYKISSKNLPFFPYIIKYNSATGSNIKLATADFVRQNSQFLTKKNVNLNIAENPTKNSIAEVNNSDQKNNNQALNNQPSQDPSVSQRNNLLLLGIVVLTMFGGVTALIGVYLYKKNKS